MTSPPTPEILTVGQIIHPSIAETLGIAALQYHRKSAGSQNPENLLAEYSDARCRSVLETYLGETPTVVKVEDIFKSAQDRFHELLEARGAPSSLKLNSDMLVGNNPDDGWHIDPRQFRLLVNLGSLPRKLLVSTSKRKPDIDISNTRELTIMTGAGVFLNSFFDFRDRIYHTGVSGKGRVLMRLIARE